MRRTTRSKSQTSIDFGNQWSGLLETSTPHKTIGCIYACESLRHGTKLPNADKVWFFGVVLYWPLSHLTRQTIRKTSLKWKENPALHKASKLLWKKCFASGRNWIRVWHEHLSPGPTFQEKLPPILPRVLIFSGQWLCALEAVNSNWSLSVLICTAGLVHEGVTLQSHATAEEFPPLKPSTHMCSTSHKTTALISSWVCVGCGAACVGYSSNPQPPCPLCFAPHCPELALCSACSPGRCFAAACLASDASGVPARWKKLSQQTRRASLAFRKWTQH